MAAEPRWVHAPPDGIWRVGRGDNPLTLRLPDEGTLASSTNGNRFDSPEASYGVLYFASTLEGCFVETLARFRPSPEVAAIVRDEWQTLHFMEVGAVPWEWRQRRTSVKVGVSATARFLDIEHLDTHQFLRNELALGLAALGQRDLDVSTVRGPDRRVTRLISNWAYHARTPEGEPTYDGIRYLSRIGSDWELWAVFQGVPLEPIEIRPIERETPELSSIAAKFGLTIM